MFASCSEYICACWNGLIRSFGRQHEDVDPLLAAHRVLGGAARVAGRRAQDIEPVPAFRERVLEQVAQELQCDVLERERRSVRHVQQMDARLQSCDRRDRVGAKRRLRVRAVDERLEVAS
jgi:hypothetical protein